MKFRVTAFCLLLSACTMPAAPDGTVSSSVSSSDGAQAMLRIASGCTQDGPTRQICYDNLLKQFTDQHSATTRELLAMLADSMHLNDDMRTACHGVAHAIGRRAYTTEGSVEKALFECNPTCFSGCLHGAVERVFFSEAQILAGNDHAEPEDIERAIPKLCRAENMPDAVPHTMEQCVHGAGHAVMFALGYQLTEALGMCDFFPSEHRYVCYSGVLMENISASDARRRDLKSDDLLYPCNTLSGQQASACYYYQPTYMLERGLSPRQVIEACETLGDHAGDCVEGYARELDIIYLRAGDFSGAAYVCEDLALGFSARCIDSVIRSSTTAFNDGSTAYAFCAALRDDGNRLSCVQSLVHYFRDQHRWTREQVQADCEKFAGEDSAICTQVLGNF